MATAELRLEPGFSNDGRHGCQSYLFMLLAHTLYPVPGHLHLGIFCWACPAFNIGDISGPAWWYTAPHSWHMLYSTRTQEHARTCFTIKSEIFHWTWHGIYPNPSGWHFDFPTGARHKLHTALFLDTDIPNSLGLLEYITEVAWMFFNPLKASSLSYHAGYRWVEYSQVWHTLALLLKRHSRGLYFLPHGVRCKMQ